MSTEEGPISIVRFGARLKRLNFWSWKKRFLGGVLVAFLVISLGFGLQNTGVKRSVSPVSDARMRIRSSLTRSRIKSV